MAITDVVICPVTTEVWIEKLALTAPAGTTTDAGIVIAATEVPSFNATLVPAPKAGWLRVTVQVEVAGEKTIAGVHVSALMTGAGPRVSVKLAELPERLATTINVTGVVDAPTAPAKVALAAPAGTVTDAGMETLAVDANPNDTGVAVDAVATKVTVQVKTAGVERTGRVHASALNRFAGNIVSVAPTPVTVMPLAWAEAPDDAVNWSAEDDGAPEDTLKLAVAIVPLEMVFRFVPQTMHVTELAPFVQESDLPAAVVDGPACKLTFVRSLAE